MKNNQDSPKQENSTQSYHPYKEALLEYEHGCTLFRVNGGALNGGDGYYEVVDANKQSFITKDFHLAYSRAALDSLNEFRLLYCDALMPELPENTCEEAEQLNTANEIVGELDGDIQALLKKYYDKLRS